MLFLGRLRRWYVDRARNLFRYHDGTRWRRADPLSVATALEAKCPTYSEHFETINEKPDDTPPGPMRNDLVKRQRAAAFELVKVSRSVFDLKPLTDDAGLGDGEALQVLTWFFVYMEGLAVEAQLFTSSPPVA